MTTTVRDFLSVDAVIGNNSVPTHPDAEFQRFFTFARGKDNAARGINNSAGFRVVARRQLTARKGRKPLSDLAFIVLVTTFAEPEWPDSLDIESGALTYYGDNRKPGKDTNSTPLGGNEYLDEIFARLHDARRKEIPPLLVFQSISVGGKRRMKFLGLAAPGGDGLTPSDDLVSVWRIKGRNRFTNKKARFTILREERIARVWLADLVEGINPADSQYCPSTWKRWCQTGFYEALEAGSPRIPRARRDQLPVDPIERDILRTVFEELSDREFEFAAAELVKLMDERFIELEVTPRSRDGGRDVVGSLRVGHDQHQLRLAVSVEAKKWRPDSAVGVRPMSRLISRLKRSDVGVFITTSFFDPQVQSELIEDKHPVLLVSGGDIARLLAMKGLAADSLAAWIRSVQERVLQSDSPSIPDTRYEPLQPRLRRVAERKTRGRG